MTWSQEAVGGIAVGNKTKRTTTLDQRSTLDEFVAALELQIAIALTLEHFAIFGFGHDQADPFARIDLWQVLVVTEADAPHRRLSTSHISRIGCGRPRT